VIPVMVALMEHQMDQIGLSLHSKDEGVDKQKRRMVEVRDAEIQ
jgi:hypothetical protein